MHLLVANTVTKITKVRKTDAVLRVWQDSTTMSRISLDETVLDTDSATGGHVLTAYHHVDIFVPAGAALYAISAGTPYISVAEIKDGGVTL